MDYSAEFTKMFESMTPSQFILAAASVLVVVVLLIIAQWKIFTKAGVPGWMSLIPILREYKLVELADGNGIKFLLLLIPFVNIVYSIMLSFRLANAFGKGTGFAFGLFLFPNLFQLILGFGSAQYIGPRGERKIMNPQV